MDRSLRRHRNRVAKFRRRNVILTRWGWRSYIQPGWRRSLKHHWQPIAKQMMTESGHKWWRKVMMTRPDRSCEHQALRQVLRGVDQDQLYWPTHRDYWIYYY